MRTFKFFQLLVIALVSTMMSELGRLLIPMNTERKTTSSHSIPTRRLADK